MILFSLTFSFYYNFFIVQKQILEEVDEVDKAEEEGHVEAEKPVEAKTGDKRQWSVVAQKILMEALVAGDSDETLNRLKKASDSLVRYKEFLDYLFMAIVKERLLSSQHGIRRGRGHERL